MSVSGYTPKSSTVSGSRIVLVMFAFGIAATATIWIYWTAYLMPFMPLQKAIESEFAKSSPRVDGGREKGKSDKPFTLRVVMRVPFDPTQDDPETLESVNTRIERTKQLAEELTEFDKYELLHVHLYNEPKEKALLQKSFKVELNQSPSPKTDAVQQP